MYQEALDDIDWAIKLGYPVKSRIKLIVRRSACEAELNKVIKNTKETPAVDESDKLLERIEIRKSENGRGMFVKSEVVPGELVLTEKPFLSVLHPNRYKTHCYHCFKQLDQRPVPCQGCRQVRFCSSECSSKSWLTYHQTECCYLDLLNVTNDFHYSPKLTLRAIIKTGLFECSDISIQEESDSTDLIATNEYKSFCSLIEHEKEDTNDYTITVVLIVAFLLEKHADHIFTRKTILSLSEKIAHHLRQVNVNGITITSKRIIYDEEIPQFDEQTIGCGVYLISRFINHSCDPNTRITQFDGDKLVLHAVKEIRQGEEILFSYGGNFRWQIMSERKRMLKNSYFFECACSACINGLQSIANALVCPDCSGPVVADGPMVCQKCGKVDHLNLKQILGDTEGCLKMVRVGQTFLDNYKSSKDKTDLEASEKAFTESYNGLKMIMYEGHPELNKVSEKLIEVLLKLEKYDEAVEFCSRVYKSLSSQYEITYYKVFNCLLKLVYYQNMLYTKLKKFKPLDKNRINTLKTDSLSNLDLLEANLKQMCKDSSIFTIKIEHLRKIFLN